ncbi:uncharacterized protein TrAFT101_007043 [Trichoderma asperellum]|uniref:uncharacterized protein n=1 Tax=Trichoderma asperellum TaxID=101201 RepID=UPI00331C7F7D|nr:hypothetical protein TrAFT101_007043 [Trichoderma asperellum]
MHMQTSGPARPLPILILSISVGWGVEACIKHSQLRTRAVEGWIAAHVRQNSKERKSPTTGFLSIIGYVMLVISPRASYNPRILLLLGRLPPLNGVLGHNLFMSLHLKIIVRTSNGSGG